MKLPLNLAGMKVYSMSRHNIANILAWIFLSFLIPEPIAQAESTNIKTENGVIHFTNTPPPARKKFQIYIKEPRPKKTRGFSNTRYDKIITKAAKRHGLMFSLIKSVISVEVGV